MLDKCTTDFVEDSISLFIYMVTSLQTQFLEKTLANNNSLNKTSCLVYYIYTWDLLYSESDIYLCGGGELGGIGEGVVDGGVSQVVLEVL